MGGIIVKLFPMPPQQQVNFQAHPTTLKLITQLKLFMKFDTHILCTTMQIHIKELWTSA
jgi:hypothetical protein